MGRRAGLNTDEARRELLEVGQNTGPLQLLTDNDLPFDIDAMNLEN